MQPDLIGGRYRVVRAIGQGGMGTVWLCRDETLERDVAVKQVGLLPGASATDSARAMREARSSAALNHRNVVTVFDVLVEDHSIWLVMELVPGRSLSEIIKQDGAIDPADVADIGAQVADGLAAAHAAGTIHRDVKPGNVMVRDDGVAKIGDFGIARTAGDPTLTQSGMLTGTPSYFAPELARGASPDAAADVWSLGATLYAAVEGRPPYEATQNPVAVLHQIASEQPSRPRRADFLEPVLLRMMDRDPSSRWSMADAAHTLHRLAGEHARDKTRASTLGAGPATLAEPAPKPRRSRRKAEVAEAAAAAAAPAAEPTSSRSAPQPPADPPPRQPVREPASDGSRHRAGYAVLVLVALLLVGGGIGYVVTRGSDSGSDSAGGKPSTSHSASHSPSRSASHSPSASSSSSASSSPSASGSASSSSTPSTSATSSGPAGGGGKASFLRSYFAVAPGGTDEGWSQLGPGERAQGRASYNSFWRGISSVTVHSAEPAGANSVEAFLTYHRTSGQKSDEHKRFDLIKSSDGRWLINAEHEG